MFAGARAPGAIRRTTSRRSTPFPPGCEIVRKIHRGGQGVVYQAIQKATKRDVAIKVMREGPFSGPRDKARFEREIEILGTLNHPHIVTIHDSGIAAGQFYFIMDYIPGQPLDVYMASENQTIKETLRLFSKICDAVNAAHLRGVIHRDLKPSNIRIDAEGEPHILDFGLAKITGSESSEPAMTVTGQFVGSLPWASPEQVDRGARGLDLRTDVYSLGIILYQMVTGRFPYNVTGNIHEVMDNIIHTEPTRPSAIRRQINDEIETIVLKCLNKERDRRYQSAGDLARDVDRYLRNEPIEAKRDSTWYVFKKTVQRYRAATAVALTFVLLVTGFAVAVSIMYQRANEEAETATRVQAVLDSLFADLGSAEQAGQLTIREFLDQGAERVADQLKDEPAAQEKLMRTIATRYGYLGLRESEAHWLERALAVRRDALEAEDGLVAARLNEIGLAYIRAGRHDRAETTFRETLRLQRKYSKGQTAEVIPTLRMLADVRHFQGAYREAERTFREALELCSVVHTVLHPDTVLTLAKLGALLDNQGDYQQAKELLEEALAMVRRLHPRDHPQVISVLRGLAGALQSMGQYAEAEPLAQEAVDMSRRLFPGDHTVVASSWNVLGLLLKDMGDYAAAEKLIHQALEMVYRLSGGQDTRAVAYQQHGLAKVYSDSGQWEKAEAACRKAIELHLKVLSHDHRDVARPMTHLGRILVHLGRYEEAEPLLREALEIRRKRKPPGHWKTAKTESVLGACLAGQGRFEEAEPLLLNSYPIIAKNRGQSNRRTQEALRRIIDFYEAWGKPEKGAEYRAMLTAPDHDLRPFVP